MRFNLCLQILHLLHPATVLLLPCCPCLWKATRCLCKFWNVFVSCYIWKKLWNVSEVAEYYL